MSASGIMYDTGGSILIEEASVVQVRDVTFQNCSAGQGGAISARPSAHLTINSSTFVGCIADGRGAIDAKGGALLVDDATVIIHGSMFSYCTAVDAHEYCQGGVLMLANENSKAIISDSEFSYNKVCVYQTYDDDDSIATGACGRDASIEVNKLHTDLKLMTSPPNRPR